MKKPSGQSDRSLPRVPLFLLAKSGRPLVWDHQGSKAVIAYSSGPLALEAGQMLKSRGERQIGVVSVSTPERLKEVVAQLSRHGVQSMIWDYLGDSPVREMIDLIDLVQAQ